jgi:dynein heavy chain, axonemal
MLVTDVVDEWIKCQSNWMYLQPIFDSPDIMGQLPSEATKFKKVDLVWKLVIKDTKVVPNVLKACTKEGLYENFQQANANLEEIQKGLADYLEAKRLKFARFFFLSNDEMLEILSQTKEVEMVRPHLKKVFENMADLEFRQPAKSIHAMFSSEGEKIEFSEPVYPKIDRKDKNVEDWMGEVEMMMVLSVKRVLLHSVDDYPQRERNQWCMSHPGQCVLNGSQIWWTKDCETAINTEGHPGVAKFAKTLNKQLLTTVINTNNSHNRLHWSDRN